MKNILVTGGSGYVGSLVKKLLIRKGYKPHILDIKVGTDIRSVGDVRRALVGMDCVIHLAGMVGAPLCNGDPRLSFDINVNGTANLVGLIPSHIPILFASSGSVYGKVKEICTEDSPLNPLSEYGKQKQEGEVLCRTKSEFIIYRFATAFGVSPQMRDDLIIHDFTKRAIADKKLVVYEKDFMRTFIHVKDMASAFLYGIEHYGSMRGQTFNVGSNDLNISKEDMCNLIKGKVGCELVFENSGHDLDQRDYTVSYDKINSVGYRTKVTIQQGIDELVYYYDRQYRSGR